MSAKTIGAKTFRSRAAFRAWLEANHDRVRELFVRCFKVEHSAKGLTYRQALDEALCFGWIDGVRRSLDETRYVIRFTPRRPTSTWSAVNTRRFAALRKAGRVRPAGIAAFRKRREELSRDPGHVESVLRAGAARAREEAGKTLARVRRAVGVD